MVALLGLSVSIGGLRSRPTTTSTGEVGAARRVITTSTGQGTLPAEGLGATTTTESAPATTAPPVVPPPSPITARLAVRDGRLLVDGERRPVLGVNVAGAASVLRLGAPCGNVEVDPDQLFSVLPDRAMVRVWFTQRMATDIGRVTRDWSAVDAVVAAAERAPNRPILLVTLATGSGDCDGGRWRDRAWYAGGAGATEAGMPNSYFGWVDEIVQRYASSPAIGAWEPVNEPDPSTCLPGFQGSGCFGHTRCDPGAAQALAGFFTTVGTRIRELDPGALVGTGGTGWCGWADEDQVRTVESSPGIDLVSAHDYHADTEPVPLGVTLEVRRGRALGKPVIVGEVGMNAAGASGRTPHQRAELLQAKVTGQVAAGADGVLLWVYGPGFCELCIGPDDPVLALLRG